MDLLIDNKNDKQLQSLPFLQRVDAVVDEKKLLVMSEMERRFHQNEIRMKGGSDKAIVRVRLSDEASLGVPLNKKHNHMGHHE